MNGHETANTDYGKTALPTGLGGCQAGFFPDYYSQPHDIKEQPLDLAQAIDWDFINDAVPGPNLTDHNTFAPNQIPSPVNGEFSPTTVDPTSLWSDSNNTFKDPFSQSMSPREPSSIDSYAVSNNSPNGSIDQATLEANPSSDHKFYTDPSASAPKPAALNRSDRARNAANKRHQKTRNARKDSHQNITGTTGEPSPEAEEEDSKANMKKLRLREKNKAAAAKCRSRQRKQVQSIESKSNDLSEANGMLKRSIQDLSAELNDLRSLALSHQSCDCRVAMYNFDQAKKLVAGLQASTMERNAPQMQGV